MNRPTKVADRSNGSDFADSLRKGVLLGAAILVLALPPAGTFPPSPTTVLPWAQRPVTRKAELGGEPASPAVRQMANWVLNVQDHRNRSFMIIDKTQAKVFVFNSAGQLKAAAPALLGEAVGDDSAPGIGDKPLAGVLPEEKTTPAGRFVAEVGMSTRGEDVIWVDYDAAVSMHRVLKIDQRVERLASATPDDNRMSFGCINVPHLFYEQVLRPAVDAGGAVIYILPETRTLSATFAGFYDVESPLTLARARR